MHTTTRKRIGIVTSTYPRWKGDSSPAFVHELAKQIHRMGHEVHVLAPHCPGVRVDEVLDGIHVHRFRYTIPPMRPRLAYGGGVATNLRRSPLAVIQLPLFVLAQLWATTRMVRRHRLDAVNAHWLVFQGLTAALVCGMTRTRLVVTAHAADVFALRRSRLGRLLTRMIFSGAAKVICVSSIYPAILGRLGGHPDKMVVLPMGVDLRRFRPLPAGEREQLRQRLFPESGGRLNLLAVGRLEEKKGFIYLVRAMQQVAREVQDVELWLIGGGSAEASLRAAVRECGLCERVHFLGPQTSDSIHEYYQASDGLVVPSIVQANGETEGMPVVILEALASGCPVIASRVSGIPDVVKDDVNGLLVEPADVAGLAATITRFARDGSLRARLAACATESVEQYSWPNVAGAYLRWMDEPSPSPCTVAEDRAPRRGAGETGAS